MGNTDKKSIQLTEREWQIVLDSLSNTIFNEEITEEARKNAKELFVKINKNVQICKLYGYYLENQFDLETNLL